MSLGAIDVGAGLGVGDRGAREQLERRVVVDVRRPGRSDAAVAVVVYSHRHRSAITSSSGWAALIARVASWTIALVVPGARALARPWRPGGRTAARAGTPSAARSPASLDRGVDREPVDAGHRGDRLAAVLAGDDEQRLDQVRDRQLGLAHEAAQQAGAAQPAQAGRGEGHGASIAARGRRQPGPAAADVA